MSGGQDAQVAMATEKPEGPKSAAEAAEVKAAAKPAEQAGAPVAEEAAEEGGAGAGVQCKEEAAVGPFILSIGS